MYKANKNQTKTKSTLGNRYHHTNLFDNPHLRRAIWRLHGVMKREFRFASELCT